MATLADDPRLQELWPDLAKGKSRKTKIGGELGSDRGKHFAKVAVDGADVWVLRTLAQHAAAPTPAGGAGAAGAAAPTPAGEEAPAAASPRAAKAAAKAAAAGGGSGHVVLGNTSEAARWRAATAEYLEKHLLRCHISVWWEGPRQFYEGRIVEILWEALVPPEGPLVLLKVLYDDQQEEWIQPVTFHVAGAQDETMVVVERFVVHIWDPSLRRYLPDPNQGEEPPGAAQDTAAAAAAAGTTPAAAAPAARQQQGAPRAGHSGSGGRRRRLAEGDRSKGRWWQQAVTGGRDASSTATSVPGVASGSPGSVPQGPAGGEGEPQAHAAAAGAAGAGQPTPAAEVAAATAQLPTGAGPADEATGTEQPALPQPAQQQEQQHQSEDQAAMQGQQREAHQGQAQTAQPSQQQGGQQEQAQPAAALERAQQDQQPPPQQQGQELAAREKRRAGSAAASSPPSPHRTQAHKAEAAALAAGRKPEQQVAAEKKRRRDAEQAQQAHKQEQQPAGKRPRSGGAAAPAAPAPKGFTIPKRAPAAAATQGPAAAAAPAAGGFTIPKRASAAAATAAAAEDAARSSGGGIKGKPTAAHAPFRIPKAAAPAAGSTPAAADVPGGSAGSKPLRWQQAEGPGPAGEQHPEHVQHGRTEPAQRDKREQHQQAQQQRQQPAERRGRQEAASPTAQRQQQQQAEKRRRRSPDAEPAPQIGQHLLRRSSSLIARNLGLVRWAAPVSEAALPAPAVTQAVAASLPALQALRDRLAAAGPWPKGDSPPAPQAALPAGTFHGRIFISKRETLSACFERSLFVSNSPLDLEGLQEGMLAVMHSLDERLVYGAFRVLAWGRRLDPSFPLPDFQYHVRVQPLRLFQPLPADLLDAICERKLHPKSGERMKFFDRHLSQKQCRQVWALLQFYCDKLHPELDMRHRFGSAFGEGWQRLLEAARAGEAGGSASNGWQGGGGRLACGQG